MDIFVCGVWEALDAARIKCLKKLTQGLCTIKKILSQSNNMLDQPAYFQLRLSKCGLLASNQINEKKRNISPLVIK